MAHPDLDKLLDILFPFAQRMLQEHGDFHPFGASMKRNGSTEMVGAYDGKDFPKAEDLIAMLQGALRKEAELGVIKAAGICFDVRVNISGGSEKTDAIEASLEHAHAEPVNVFLPYRKGLFKKITYGQIFASAGESRIFTHSR